MALCFAIDIIFPGELQQEDIQEKYEYTEHRYGEALIFSSFLNDFDDKEYTSCFGYLFVQDEAQFTE